MPSKEVADTEAALPAYIEALEAMRSKIADSGLHDVSIKALTRGLEQAQVYADELDGYEKTLQGEIDVHKHAIEKLKAVEDIWVATLQNAVSENAPEAIVERINKTLVNIALVRDTAKRSYDKVLTFMDMAVAEHQKLETVMKEARQTRIDLESRLFVRDSEPLFDALVQSRFDAGAFLVAVGRTLNDIKQTFFAFYKNNRDSFALHLVATLFILSVMLYLYFKERHGMLFIKYDDKIRGSLSFVRSPVAATVVLSVLIIAAIYPERPAAVSYLNVLTALVALLCILYRSADAVLLRYAGLLAALYAIGGLFNQVIGYEAEIRLIWFVLTVVMMLSLFTIFRPGGLLESYQPKRWLKLVLRLGPLAIFLLAVSLVANLFGYYHLSHKLSNATLISMTIFMAFGVVAMVLGGLITMFVRRRSLESKHLLESYALQIENNLKFIVNGFLVLYWLYLVFNQFEISRFAQEYFTQLMAMSWQVGDVTISVGSLVDFIVVLVLTTFLTRFVRITLDLELFSRYEFPRGVPTAIQMMIRYLIIGVGILLALSVLGIRMSDLSLLAGALGVGIGFGLRNIMANFVSGLLMIFERPVQLGDVIEVDKVFGDVQRIGVRATTIKTYDGSEVIVPNADFITKEVINWTLSSKLRRIKMAYKVAFGNDPKGVIEIIKDVLLKHSDVKSDPEPKVLFEGYGDYYLEFTVYFWVEDRLLDIKSETAIDIYEALSEAGVRMPVPQVRYEGGLPST
ncbi:MAG TPA: mechanosensitive ion channel [Sulfuricurvum sp.]|nr:mechanosensitive ion channel [Sulfuricurvum sp.]